MPFGALPKAVSEGALPGMTGRRVDGFVRLLLSRRPVRGRAWVALGLSFAALAGVFRARGSLTLSSPAVVCLALYTGAYLLRLRVMSHAAKTEHGGGDRRAPALRRRRNDRGPCVAARSLATVLG